MSETAKRAFLTGTGWETARIAPLAGDASARAYDRLHLGDRSTILMILPEGSAGELAAFCRIADHLSRLGLAAPALLKRDPDARFLLLEDLGEGLFPLVREPGPAQLYTEAAAVLLHLHRAPPPAGLARYDSAAMAAACDLAWQWYRPALTPGPGDFDGFRALFREHLAPLDATPPVLLLRDYHAENLIWRGTGEGLTRVGLLDFQDALLGNPAYDLASLLLDARHDVDPTMAEALIDSFAAQRKDDPTAFRRAFALMGLQRNLRLLGIFTRLALRDGKPRYLAFLPRVWRHVETCLAQLDTPDLTQAIRTDLPAPDAATILRLQDKCA
ncbi:MAG: phosphotransferase [Rhodobacteraceae bacterium]|nr:phosphotransferase [Paracoccaceae bacterium]